LCQVSLDVVSVNSFDFDKKEVTFHSVLPHLNFTGSYKVSGKVATLPIAGKGAYTALFCKNAITVTSCCWNTITVTSFGRNTITVTSFDRNTITVTCDYT
jgi:xanthine/uracil permease